MRKIVFILLIFFILVIQSLAVEIKGEILNLEGKPVADAIVLHRSSGNKAVTDEKGHFSLNVPEEAKIRLEVVHPEYLEQEIIVTSQTVQKGVTIQLVPYIMKREEIVVTALRYPESSSSVPAAETVIPKETLEERMAPNITEGLSNLPGVSSLGSGGFSIVPNIRGLARSRVLLMIDNARVTSDRRVGPNASFIDPNNIEKIEVLRSPSSVFYGSDAIGGVIHILTRKPSIGQPLRGNLKLKYGTINEEKGLGFSVEGSRKKTGFCLFFQGNDAENYSSPSSEILQSQFTQANVLAKVSHLSEKREIHLSFLGSRGKDIGKPNVDSLTKPTWYPRENQNLFQFHWLERGVGGRGELAFQTYLNPNFLETKKEKIEATKTGESYSKTQSMDYGFTFSYARKIGQNFRLVTGTDLYGRAAVKASNVETTFDAAGNVTDIFEEWPYTEGSRRDLGLFISGDFAGIKNLDLIGGVRWDLLRMEALPGDTPPSAKRDYSTLTGFLGSSVKLSENIVVFGNLSRAYRAPGLGELFYTGISGRGYIIAQPGLKPEVSLNLDSGIKFIEKRFFAGLYAFYYALDDLIERYTVEPRIYTYGNIDRGMISGYELEMEYYPVPGWKIFGNIFSFRGKSKETDSPLNDVPPARLFAGTRVWIGRFSTEINASFQQEKKNPGPAEIQIPSYELVNFMASYHLSSHLRFYLVLSNLLDESYLARPDPESVQEPGRNLVLGLSLSF
jgi:outer membrane receptor protein involved in Fe transport